MAAIADWPAGVTLRPAGNGQRHTERSHRVGGFQVTEGAPGGGAVDVVAAAQQLGGVDGAVGQRTGGGGGDGDGEHDRHGAAGSAPCAPAGHTSAQPSTARHRAHQPGPLSAAARGKPAPPAPGTGRSWCPPRPPPAIAWRPPSASCSPSAPHPPKHRSLHTQTRFTTRAICLLQQFAILVIVYCNYSRAASVGVQPRRRDTQRGHRCRQTAGAKIPDASASPYAESGRGPPSSTRCCPGGAANERGGQPVGAAACNTLRCFSRTGSACLASLTTGAEDPCAIS